MPEKPDPLVGMLFAVLLLAAVLAPLVSIATLTLYRRAVVRGMRTGRGAAVGGSPPAPATAPHAELELAAIEADPPLPLDREATALHARMRRAAWRSAAIEGIGGLAHAFVLAVCWSAASGTPTGPGRLAALVVAFLWPGALAAVFVAAATRRDAIRVLAAYAAVVAAGFGIALSRNADTNLGTLLFLWLLLNGLPTVFLSSFLISRIRAVAPLVMLCLLIGFAGSQLSLGLLAGSEAWQRRLTGFAVDVGVQGAAGVTFAAVAGFGFLALAVVAVGALFAIRRLHAAKRLNDQSLPLHALWLMFAFGHAFTLIFEGRVWVLAGPAAYLARTVAVTLATRIAASRGPDPQRNARLLLLRVFSLGRRGERQFGAIERCWRHLGSIQMIAGPDLATRTVEPHEIMAFATGRLGRLFIDGAPALDRRIAEMDVAPDRDGRFRVNDFFCHDDTWRATLARLVGASDAVLMDLRGFGPPHAGCLHELRELVARVPLARIVLAIDATTDRPFLERSLREAWRALPVDSPNLDRAPARIAILREGGGDGDLRQLLRSLCAAATSRATA